MSTSRIEYDMRALIERARANVPTAVTRAPWSGSHRGGWDADAWTSRDVYVGDTACYEPVSAPDGAQSRDRANKGWSAAWARQNSTRAGKSERRSMLVGSQRGARRGEIGLEWASVDGAR